MTPVARPQTIQIFLPLGDPRGIRIAEITTRMEIGVRRRISFAHHSFTKLRAGLIEQGRMVVEGDVTMFTSDGLFASPSGASAVVCAAASNGRLDWKNAHGRTLDEIK